MKLIKVKCKVCDKEYECAKGSVGQSNELCAKCWAIAKVQEIINKFKMENYT